MNLHRELVETIEMGCRGFPAQSLHQTLKRLGARGLKERKATKNISELQRALPGDCGSIQGIYGVASCLDTS